MMFFLIKKDFGRLFIKNIIIGFQLIIPSSLHLHLCDSTTRNTEISNRKNVYNY